VVEQIKNIIPDKTLNLKDIFKSGVFEQIGNIITDIYIKIYGRNGQKNVDDIIDFFLMKK